MSACTIQRRVAWVDTDASGRIHWTAPIRWAEAAEAELVGQLGYIDDWRSFPRRHLEVDYLSALVFNDPLDIHLWVERVGTTSITFAWEVARAGELCIKGSHTTVHIDDDGRPAPLPPAARAAIAEPR